MVFIKSGECSALTPLLSLPAPGYYNLSITSSAVLPCWLGNASMAIRQLRKKYFLMVWYYSTMVYLLTFVFIIRNGLKGINRYDIQT